MTRVIVLAALIALGVTSCGKRARYLDPPAGTHDTFPKHYPPPDDPGTKL
jgi:hypothetical protein